MTAGWRSPTTPRWEFPHLRFPSSGRSAPASWMRGCRSSWLPGKSHSVTFQAEPVWHQKKWFVVAAASVTWTHRASRHITGRTQPWFGFSGRSSQSAPARGIWSLYEDAGLDWETRGCRSRMWIPSLPPASPSAADGIALFLQRECSLQGRRWAQVWTAVATGTRTQVEMGSEYLSVWACGVSALFLCRWHLQSSPCHPE